jgi:hypothetical protein
MNLDKKDKITILENACSYVVVFAMLVYGGAKIVQFSGANQVSKTVAEMTGQELMWAFYGYSFPYILTIGFLEIAGGMLLFFPKTRIIGCLLVSSILVNVILQDIFFGVNVGALRAAILYQSLILFILWLNKQKLIQALKLLCTLPKLEQSKKKFFFVFFLSVCLFLVFRILEYYLTIIL